MADIVESIIIKDEIAPTIETSLDKIATSADKAEKQIKDLSSTLRTLRAMDLSRLSSQLRLIGNASTRIQNLTNSINNESNAHRLLNENVSRTTNSIRNNTASITQSITATQRATLATNMLAQAARNAETAQARLQTANIRQRTAGVQLGSARIRRDRQQVGLEIDQTRLANQNVLLQQRTLRLRQMENAARSAARGTNVFNQSLTRIARNIVIGTTLAYTISKIAEFGDATTRLTNQLSLIETSGAAANKTLLSLSQVANNSYSDLDATVKLYTRLAQALDQVGATRQEAQSITETLSKTVQLAGLTGGEASAALLQISQAFNKGKLDGDEFRTVMETMPTLADAIAKSLNTTRGALLKLAPQGKITADVMRKAIAEMADTIDYKFANMTPTVSQSFTQIANDAKLMGGELWKQLGAADALRKGFSLLANNMQTVLTVGTALGVGMLGGTLAKGAMTATTAVRELIIGTRTLKGALLALNVTPFGLIATALSVGAYALMEYMGTFDKFGGELSETNIKLKNLSDNLAQVNGQMSNMSSIKLEKTFDDLNSLVGQSIKEYQKLEEQIKVISNAKMLAMGATESQNILQKLNNTTSITTENYKKLNLTFDETSAAMGKLINLHQHTNNLSKDQSILTKQLVDLQGQLLDSKEKLQQQVLSEINAQTHLNNKINKYKDVLKDKTSAEIKANATLSRTQALLDQATAKYKINSGVIAEQTALLKKLGITLSSVNLEMDKGNAQKAAIAAANNAVAKLEVMTRAKQIALEKAKAKGNPTELANIAVKEATEKNKQLYDATRATEAGRKEWEKYIDTVRKATIAENTHTKSLTKRKSALEKANDKYKEYVLQLDKEHELLSISFEDYEKYRGLYKSVFEWRQKGLKLSESEINALKAKIDANRELMEQQERVQKFKDNSYAKKDEDYTKNVNAFLMSDPSKADKDKFGSDQANDIAGGQVTGVEYYNQLVANANQAYSKIDKLRQADLISEQTAHASKAMLFAKQQQEMIAPVQGALTTIAQLQGSHNKKIAKIGKAAAIANAIMQTYTSATAAYASAAAIPYVGWIMAPVAAGVAVAAGMANVAAIRSQPTGYKQGGFTGYQGIDTPAGIVHGNEFVMDRDSTRSLGVENLEALRRGTAYIANRNDNNNQKNSVNVNIQNYGTDKDFEVNTLSTGDVEIICKDVIRKQQRNIVKSYLNSDEGQEIIAKTARRNS